MNTLVVAACLISIILGLQPVFSQEQIETTGSDSKIWSKPGPEGSLLKKGDTLQFRIVGETETDSILVVSADGTSLFPYIGSVEMAGRTVREIREELFHRYDRDYFVSPQVQIRVTHTVERKVHMLGAVKQPGPIQIPRQKPLSLLQAISEAGGFARTADRRRIELKRSVAGERATSLIIDLATWGNPDRGKKWVLRDGDIVIVPSKGRKKS